MHLRLQKENDKRFVSMEIIDSISYVLVAEARVPPRAKAYTELGI
jgi:hypothetical protein